MGRFELLTEYIPKIKAVDVNVNGALYDNPILREFEYDVHVFVEDTPDLNLYDYSCILEKNDIEYNDNAIKTADYKSMDGQAVAALIVAVVRAERTYEGIIERFFQNGYILKWLERLKEIDEKGG